MFHLHPLTLLIKDDGAIHIVLAEILFLKEICLSPGHDRVVTIKSRNFSIAKVW